MKDGVYLFKSDAKIADLEFKKNQELEIVGGVIYMGGFLFPPARQKTLYSWLQNNSDLIINDTRGF